MAELKGSKTEKNLMEAFAGESMARNKYTYYASRNTLKFGLKFFMTRISHLQLKTCSMLLKVKIMSGPTCMLVLQKMLVLKDSPRLRLSLTWLEKLKKNTKLAIANFLQMLKVNWYSLAKVI